MVNDCLAELDNWPRRVRAPKLFRIFVTVEEVRNISLTCISTGKALKFIWHMKVILLAMA